MEMRTLNESKKADAVRLEVPDSTDFEEGEAAQKLGGVVPSKMHRFLGLVISSRFPNTFVDDRQL
jgi:hypothetical protein